MKLPSIRRKLLQCADTARGTYDGYKVTLLHLLVNKFLQGTPDIICALPGECQIVDDKSDRSTRVLGPGRRDGNGRQRDDWPLSSRCGFAHVRNERKIRDFLLFSVLID